MAVTRSSKSRGSERASLYKKRSDAQRILTSAYKAVRDDKDKEDLAHRLISAISEPQMPNQDLLVEAEAAIAKASEGGS